MWSFNNFFNLGRRETNDRWTLAETDVARIIDNRKLFDQTLYTPLDKAQQELKQRRENKALQEEINKFLQYDIPEPFCQEPRAVLFRNLITPNYETRRFVSITNGFGKLKPLFFEYTQDKFTSNNELKRTLGKLYFAHSRGKKGGINLDTLNIIDFVKSDGKRINEVTTNDGKSLVDFHHAFYKDRYATGDVEFFDASNWLKARGSSKNYYIDFLTLFIRHGILFENMTLEKKERDFAEKVFLPAFLKIYKQFGLKPLIVALEPTHIEGDLFWLCYPGADKEYVQKSCMIDK